VPLTPQRHSSQLNNPEHLHASPVKASFKISSPAFVAGWGIFGRAPVSPVHFSFKF